MPTSLVLASRGSKLALTQARIVADMMRALDPSLTIDIRTVKTVGDKDDRPFGAIGGRGLFVTEVEREVAEGRADLAVHSAKDLTAELAPGCALVCVPARGPVHDVVVGGDGASGEARIASLRPGAVVGTSSMRRRALLAEARPELEVADLRGNLDTRLRKVERGDVDVAILAAAGLERIGITSGAPLDPHRWVPPPGQGALAVEALSERTDLAELFAPLSDAAARAEVVCERAFAAELEGGCSVPLGCLARADQGTLSVTGFIGHPEGMESMRDRISGGMDEAAGLGIELAKAILAGGGDALLEDLGG